MSAIVLDFELSSEWDRRAQGVDLRAVDEMKLRYDCFLGNIVFKVDEVDFSTRWGWVPVFDFALSLRAIAGALVAQAQQTFEFTESEATLDFVREDARVRIEASYVPAVAHVAHVELSLQAEHFLSRMVRELMRGRPELADNEFVSALSRELTVSS